MYVINETNDPLLPVIAVFMSAGLPGLGFAQVWYLQCVLFSFGMICNLQMNASICPPEVEKCMLTKKTCELKPCSTCANGLPGKLHMLYFTGILGHVGQNTTGSNFKSNPTNLHGSALYLAWAIWSHAFTSSCICSPSPKIQTKIGFQDVEIKCGLNQLATVFSGFVVTSFFPHSKS